MKLPFFNKSNNEDKAFFGLFLKEQQGIGMVMKMDGSNVVLLDQEKFLYPDGLEHLTEAVDEVILKLEQRTKVRLHETIFFIYSHFVDEKTKEIKKVYLDKVKDLVKKLNLKALGYIESYEAVIHYLEKKEEMPLTAVLLELDHSNLSVFVYKRGELTYAKVLAHTDNLIDDLLTSFTEIKGKFVLPSRIILYNSKDLDNESTEIVTYRWSEELFVQLPRVEILKEHELIQGMLGVFAEQYGKKTTSTIFTENKTKEEVLGFVIGEDVTEVKEPKQEMISTEKPQAQSGFSLSSISDKFMGLIKNVADLPKFFNKKWTIIAGLILIIAGIFLNEYFLHKASLTLFLQSQSIKKELNLTTADLNIKTESKTVDLNDTKATSGKKEIGEKAKGSVTIHNFDDNEKTFSKGSILETGGLKFSLDQEVKVASASVITINGGLVKQPGKAKTTATANEIGNQSNIASGKQFKIADFPNALYFAINESAFTGGTKKEIKTTAKKDMDDLSKNIEVLAKKQKIDVTKNNKNPDNQILNQLTEIDITEEKFDKEVGEEGNSLNLESKVKITVYFFNKKEITDVLAKTLAGESEKGFELKKDKLTYSVKDASVKGDVISLIVSAEAKSIRDISVKDVMKRVKGKNTGSLENLLKKDFKVQGYKLDVKPDIPFLQNLMPFFDKNIMIKISSL